MESTDVQPSRLQAARTAARELIDRLPDPFLVGVVGFARTAQTLNRPTIDRVAARRALARLTTEWGTALGEGIEEALKTRVVSPQTAASHPPPPTVIVLLSDGNNTTGETTPDRAARDARAAEVRVYTIALGERQEVPGAGIVGHPVRPPDYDMLSGIADHTGGRFFSAPTSEALKTIYSRLGSRIGTVREPKEITVYFVGAAFLLLLVGGALSSLWFKRLP